MFCRALTGIACYVLLTPIAWGQATHWEEISQTVERPPLPSIQSNWIRTPIDSFIAAAHEGQGLVPAPEAPRYILLRRLYLDLIGLPPSRAALQEFLADESHDAYEKVVERLLASPHYGERWGRHWMDIWRYSDWAGWSGGNQIRDSQPHIWRWRDWIVESLNADKGYDQMVLEMLAADELYPQDESALRATGYLVRNYKMLSRETWMQDAVDHTAQAFLGMTLGCARCHDHKYDPVSQEEYYQVRAFFEPHQVRLDPLDGILDTAKHGLCRVYDAQLDAATYLYIRGDDRKPDKDRPLSPAIPQAWGGSSLHVEPVELAPEAYYPGLRPEIREAAIAEHESKVAAAEAALAKARGATPSAEIALAEKSLATARSQLTAVRARIAADVAKYSQGSNVDALARAAGKAERNAAVLAAEEQLARAEHTLAQAGETADAKSEKAVKALEQAKAKVDESRKALEAARTAAAEPSADYQPLTAVYPSQSSGRRLALARWIADPQNPMTARVAINHIWRRHFGQAIVPTVFDLGNNGRRATHPELLDWLAAELMEPSWNHAPANERTGSWSMKHIHRLIVTSSTYRMSGASSSKNAERDPDNTFLWHMPPRRMEAELVRDGILFVASRLDPAIGGPEFDQNQGRAVPRRSLYFRHAAEKQMQLLKIFDAAAVTECYERKESIVPQQALAMMNSELTLVSARQLARSLVRKEPKSSPKTFAAMAFETVLSRPPTEDELDVCVRYLEEQSTVSGSEVLPSGKPVDLADFNKPATDPALRAKENLVHVLMNHNDFVMIR